MDLENWVFEWDNTIQVSNNKYPSKISHYIDGECTTLEYTAKELIEDQVYKAKKEIEVCETEKKDISKLKTKLQKINRFNGFFETEIEPIDLLGIFENDEIELIYDSLKYRFIDKEKNLDQEIKQISSDIRSKIYTIKRICLENVSLILKKEGVKAYKTKASALLFINNIESTDKTPLKVDRVGNYRKLDLTIK